MPLGQVLYAKYFNVSEPGETRIFKLRGTVWENRTIQQNRCSNFGLSCVILRCNSHKKGVILIFEFFPILTCSLKIVPYPQYIENYTLFSNNCLLKKACPKFLKIIQRNNFDMGFHKINIRDWYKEAVVFFECVSNSVAFEWALKNLTNFLLGTLFFFKLQL